MATKTKSGWKEKDKDAYLRLVCAFPLSSIRSDKHLEEAQFVIDRLLARANLEEGETMYLDALSDLVALYEDQQHAIQPASDADMLRHLLHSKAITAAELSQQTEIAKSSISEVLAGKKPFSRHMMRKLADYFQIQASLLAGNL